jgi:hypothetical protein
MPPTPPKKNKTQLVYEEFIITYHSGCYGLNVFFKIRIFEIVPNIIGLGGRALWEMFR